MVRPQLRTHARATARMMASKSKKSAWTHGSGGTMGVHQRGSHFPICVFTNNVGRRSPKKLEERKQRQMQRPWFVPRWSQGSQERPPLRARPQQGSQADADPQQGSQADADPQQGWHRPEERPAVAGENMPDSLEPWRGRRGRRSDGQPMSSGTWPGGTWSDAGATNALGWGKYKAAVAASEPMKVASSMGTSRVWSD